MAHRKSKTAPPTTIGSLDPLDLLIAREESERLNRALDSLPEKRRRLLDLAAQGVKMSRVGRDSETNPGTLRHNLAGAKAAMRSMLGPEIPEVLPGTMPVNRVPQFDKGTEAPRTDRMPATPKTYHPPEHGWLTPFMLAMDKQAYLDLCFGDALTVLPWRGTEPAREGTPKMNTCETHPIPTSAEERRQYELERWASVLLDAARSFSRDPSLQEYTHPRTNGKYKAVRTEAGMNIYREGQLLFSTTAPIHSQEIPDKTKTA